jgi:acetyltransferase
LNVDSAAAAKIISRHEGQDVYLPQIEAFDVLRAYGIGAPAALSVSAAGDLKSAAAKVGFPCVLKVDAEDVVHKSDAGGVVLDIADEAALQQAFGRMQDQFSGKNATFLLMAQENAGSEIIIGIKAAPGLGSLVMFGLGGIFVEVMQDVVVAVAPLSRPEAQDMMQQIKGFPVLAGLRGQPGVDLDAVTDILLRVSRLAADFPAISEMDLNPLFVYPAGSPPVAVDVRLKVS